MIQQKYVLNMVPGGSPVRVNVSQYDEDSRELVFGLYSGSGSGPAFTVPDGAVVTCDGTKPDGKGFSVLAAHDGDTVTVTVTKQMTAVSGETRCQLTVNKDGAVLGSANFVLIVERGALDTDADMSESEYSVLEDLRNQTVTNAQIAQAAANEINAAQDELAAAITAAGTAKSGLETATQDAGAANTSLTTATSAANTARGNLQEATTAALEANDALAQPTADAQAAKTSLDAANQTAQDNLDALQDADAMAQKIPLVQGAAAGNVPLLNADGSLKDSGKPLTPAGIGAAPAGMFADNAGAHNSIYRGKNLGTAVTEAQWASISAGTFKDMYIGDYWTIGGVTYRIAAFDYYLRAGDTDMTTHHVTLVPDASMYNHAMNDSNVTTGGYVGSKMYTEGLEQAKTTINNAFGSAHILTHRQYLCNAVSNGKPSGGSWYDSTVELMTEHNVYGGKVFGAGNDGSTVPALYTVDKSQYPLFAFRPDLISNRNWIWLRDVVSDDLYAFVGNSGFAYYNYASSSSGVRPAFSIC